MVQIKFLQSLHDKAEQEITFHCKNSVAYRDSQSKSKDRAILLTTFNGDWLSANSKKKFRYKVTEDGCQVTVSCQLSTVSFYSRIFYKKYTRIARILLPTEVRVVLYFIMFHLLFFFIIKKKVKDGSWGKTVFEIKTKKTNRLPIVDIGIADIGQQDQAFKVEVGRVCFSWYLWVYVMVRIVYDSIDFCDRKIKIPIIFFLSCDLDMKQFYIAYYLCILWFITHFKRKSARGYSRVWLSECERVFVRGCVCVRARAQAERLQWEEWWFF